MSIDYEKALALVLENASLLSHETLTLTASLGRVLAKDVISPIDQPPFARSPLDGYALRAADSIGASRQEAVKLKVIDKIFAGGSTQQTIANGECMRVMTGSMLAKGCDSVVRQEHTDAGEDFVKIYQELAPYDNYIPAASDFSKETLLLRAGTYLDAKALFTVATAGCGELEVIRRPKIVLISTGDELVTPGQPLPLGKIYNSNCIYLSSRLKEMGSEMVTAKTCGDDIGKITEALLLALDDADLVLTTGGVSVGQKDFLPQIVEAIGATTIFHGIAMKPGMPTLFARYETTPILSLSGNPFAAASVFELLARPLLAELSGNAKLALHRSTAVLQTDFPKSSPGRRFVRGNLNEGKVYLPEGHASSQVFSYLGCNCFIDIPAGSDVLNSGQLVEIVEL